VRVSSLFVIRAFFLILMLAGGGLGIAYPWLQQSYSGYTIGTWKVFDGTTFTRAEARPAPSEAPLFVSVEMITRGPLRADREGAVLTLTAQNDGRTVLAEALDFEGVEGRIVSPQSGDVAYRTEAGRIPTIGGDGLLIDVARGDYDRVDIVSVAVTVEAGAIDIQPNAIPVGYTLLAVGLIGFIATFRSRAPKNPNSSPPPPRKWGRQ
jgi:hypothetical protein